MLARVYLKEAFDIEYDLYNHDDPNLSHPLQFQLWTEKKSIKKDGLMRRYLKLYHIHQIQKYFGLSFIEFIDLPIDKVDDMLTMTNELEQAAAAALENDRKKILANFEGSKQIGGADGQMDMTQYHGF